MSQNARSHRCSFNKYQGHRGYLGSCVGRGRGQRRSSVPEERDQNHKDTDPVTQRSSRERYLFQKKVIYELDKVDDLIQDFTTILHKPFVPLPVPPPCSHLVRLHHTGPMKTLEELSEESGLGLPVLSGFPWVMTTQEISDTLQAIDFTPPVTFLRINTLKSNVKEVCQELMKADVNAWLPRWSSVTILAVDNPNNPCPPITRLLAEGRCFQQRERKWHQVTVPLARHTKKLKQPGNTESSTDSPVNTVKGLTLFYSAYGSISSLVVMVLSAKPEEDVLEICATNSGKTPHIAAMQMNSGTLVVNTLHAKEVQAMVASNSLHDVQNCVVTNIEPAVLAKTKAGKFHRVLVDAPSSGAGVVRLPPEARVCRTINDLKYISDRQKLLLLNGAECVKQAVTQNSYLIYTTCSVLVEENEEVVQHLLMSKPQFRLVPTGLDIGQPGLTHYKTHSYHKDMCLTKRIYCHHYHMDGAFIAKFVLESEVNTLHTNKIKRLLQAQEIKHQQEQNSREMNRDGKAEGSTSTKSRHKKGTHEWLTHTFFGKRRRHDDHSDDD